MKLQNKIITLSTVAALAMFTGCAKDDDDKVSSSTYSDAAVKSIIDYNINKLGTKIVDINTTNYYNDKNQLIKVVTKSYNRSYDEYLTNDGSIPTLGIDKSQAETYRLKTVTCEYTPNEDGFATTKVCQDAYIYSVAGKPEQGYDNLTDYDKTVVDATVYDKKFKTYKQASKYVYNDNNYLTEVNTVKTTYNDTNGSANSDLDTTKVTYEYITHSDDINDPIAQTIIKNYNDVGSLDSDNIVIPDLDGIAEHYATTVLDFSYNENSHLDIISKKTVGILPVYKSPTNSDDAKYFIYDGNQLDFVKDDESHNSGDGDGDFVLADNKLVYQDGHLHSTTGHIANFNNDDLNDYVWNDQLLEFIYDGNKVERVKSGASKTYTEYTYENFDNVLTSYKPLSDYQDIDLDVIGQIIYNSIDLH